MKAGITIVVMWSAVAIVAAVSLRGALDTFITGLGMPL